jgi:hypothetical protein
VPKSHSLRSRQRAFSVAASGVCKIYLKKSAETGAHT